MFRFLTFALVNLAVITVLGTLCQVLGLDRAAGFNTQGLLVFAAILGMAGSFISLLMSKFMAKMSLGVHIIDPENPGGAEAGRLVTLVKALSQKAALSGLPEIGVYESPEVNAFATGASESSALVAVSTGLLDRMDDKALKGVLGHEISHIKNGDMVTMALIQGVVNTFVIFISQILAAIINNAVRSRDERDGRGGQGLGWFAQIMLRQVLQNTLMVLAMPLVFWVSRWREYRADSGSARIAGRDSMIHALQSLQSLAGPRDQRAPALATMKISSGGRPTSSGFYSSHPSLEERIEALRQGA